MILAASFAMGMAIWCSRGGLTSCSIVCGPVRNGTFCGETRSRLQDGAKRQASVEAQAWRYLSRSPSKDVRGRECPADEMPTPIFRWSLKVVIGANSNTHIACLGGRCIARMFLLKHGTATCAVTSVQVQNMCTWR